MSNDINSINSNPTNLASTRGEGRAVANTDKSTTQESSRSAATDQVSLTSTAGKLQALESSLSMEPVVDKQRVAELKSAIESGQFQINTKNIVNNLLTTENALFGEE